MEIETIIQTVKSLPLKAALAYLISKKILDLSQKGYESIKKVVQEKASIKNMDLFQIKMKGIIWLKSTIKDIF